MFIRSIIGFALALLGVGIAFFVYDIEKSEDNKDAKDILIQVETNINNLSAELGALVRDIHETDSKTAFIKISKAKAITDRAQSKLNEVKGRIQNVPNTVRQGGGSVFEGIVGAKPKVGGSSRIRWDKNGALNAINKLESELNKSRILITQATIAISSVSAQMIDIDSRVSQLDSNIKKELSSINLSIKNNKNAGPSINIWLTILVSFVGVISGISTIMLGWRKDRREFIELKEKISVDSK